MGLLFSMLYFSASWVVGLAIQEATRIALPLPVRHAYALTIGLVIMTLSIFLVAFVIGLNVINIIITTLLLVIPSVVYLTTRPEPFKILEINKKELLIPACLLAILLVITLIFTKSIYQDANGITAGNRLIWTDGPIHFSLVASFLNSNNFPPQNPQYAGSLITYPFFSDFLSSILMTLGASLKAALAIPGIILGGTLITLLFFVGTILVNNKKIALLGTIIAIFWGGLGFIYFFQDIASSQNVLETLLFPKHEYTFFSDKNLWFFSFLYSELLPQRSFLFGLPMFLVAFITLLLGLFQKKKSYIVVAGWLVAIMPFFHMHAYLSFLMFASVFTPLHLFSVFKQEGLVESKKAIKDIVIFFGLPILGLGLIQLPIFTAGNLDQTISWHFGWMKGGENFFSFYFKNTGFFWPLWIFALLAIKINPLVKNVAIATTILFILPNIFSFAKWPYDNLKIMTFWYFISAFFVAQALYYIYKKGNIGKTIAVVLFLSLTLSGFIEVSRVLNSEKNKIPLWSKKDIELSQVIRENTEEKATIVTAAIHDHPVTGLAGRKIIIGYPGNAWSWGLADWQEREQDVHKILQADPRTLELLAKYNANYILISPRERYFEPKLNEEYFSQNTTLVAIGDDYKLFRVK